MRGKFDVVIMSEVLYNREYYPGLLDMIKHCLDDSVADPLVLIATKTFYFGLGGGRFEL